MPDTNVRLAECTMKTECLILASSFVRLYCSASPVLGYQQSIPLACRGGPGLPVMMAHDVP